ncbi:class I SAM-dependent methyltransferase [Methylocystis iwaonis]|uniref:Ubiquinone/menaquinone biosynthesis methyltransferase n=1 Tax=Methylocystis iwaonis TaxID=2885079 RepID=A0ABN6V8X1_9HYPH|nr:class I SAM-dependent methyltransferase [Methylocystis iwaonis]BDV32516.1 ubiquinone/menaquinone biosynthesis methyltransferase [Methylocystis iwaonis]
MSAKGYDGDIPQNYDRGLGSVLFLPYAEEAARRIAALEPQDVLEVAAGSGVATRALRDRLPSTAKLTATDISADMLTIARSKIGDGEQVRFEIVDACALPYLDASFDAIVGQFGYMFFPEKQKAMREAWRALRPNGRYALTVWDAEQYNPWASLCLEVLRGFFPENPPQWMREPVSCGAIDPIKENLLASGFENISVSVLKRARDIDALAFAHGIVFGSPVFDEIRERGGVEPETVMQAYAGTLTRAVGRSMPMQAIMFEAQKPA